MLNFSTYRCNFCGKVGSFCQNPECKQKRRAEEMLEMKNLEDVFDAIKVGDTFEIYDFGAGEKKIQDEFILEELRLNTKVIRKDSIKVKGIFKKKGSDEKFLYELIVTSNGATISPK